MLVYLIAEGWNKLGVMDVCLSEKGEVIVIRKNGPDKIYQNVGYCRVPFYIHSTFLGQLQRELGSNSQMLVESTIKTTLFGRDVVEVKVNIPWDLKKVLLAKYPSEIFEADLGSPVVYTLDNLESTDFTVEWNKLYIDIETGFSSKSKIDIENTPDQVLCVGMLNKGKFYWFYWGQEKVFHEGDIIFRFENERDMLIGVMNVMKKLKPDTILGWNVNFDTTYLFNRYIKVLGKDEGIRLLTPEGSYNLFMNKYTIPGIHIYDLLSAYKVIRRNQAISFSLDSIGEEELGEKKVHVRIRELSILPKEKLYEYNKQDVILTQKLDEKLGIFFHFDSLRLLVKCPIKNLAFASSILEFMLLRKARSLNKVLPIKKLSNEQKPIPGAYVVAVPGLWDGVGCLDVSAFYPSLIKSFNLSMETIVPKDTPVTKEIIEIGEEAKVRIDKRGLIPLIIDDLILLRKYYDDEKAKYPFEHEEYKKNDVLIESVKTIIDAIYGVNAFPQFRMYKPEVSSTITYLGRYFIKITKALVEDAGYQVVLTDTDSVYFVVGKDKTIEQVIEIGNSLVEIINANYTTICKDTYCTPFGCLSIKFKKVYDRLVVLTKKRYIGRVRWVKGHYSEGLETVGASSKRSDFSKFARDLQISLTTKIINNISKPDLLLFLNKTFENMKMVPFTEIGIPTKIAKNLTEYTTNLPKLRGAKFVNGKLSQTWDIGDKPLLLFTKGESDVILFESDEEVKQLLTYVKIDWNKMYDRNIFKIVENELIIVGLGDVYNEFIQTVKGQRTLSAFV